MFPFANLIKPLWFYITTLPIVKELLIRWRFDCKGEEWKNKQFGSQFDYAYTDRKVFTRYMFLYLDKNVP